MHVQLRTRSRWLTVSLTFALAAIVAALALGPTRAAQAQQALTPTGAPRVNVAPCYQVDANWPQKPADITWAAVPAVAVDAQDNVWIFTRANPPVQVYDRSGKLIRSWGNGLFEAPHSLRFDHQGNLWLVDARGHVVRQFTPEGKLWRTLGTPGQPGCDATHFNKPTDVAVTPAGDIFITDGYGNARIAHFDKTGKFVKQWGKPGIGPGEFSLPHSIVVDSRGRLYVADRSNVRVDVFDQDGKLLDQWSNVLVPWGLWISKNDEIWVCGSSPMPWGPEPNLLGCPPKDQVFAKFSPGGRVLQLWTVPKGEDGKEKPGELNWLHGIALDSQGNVFVGDIKGQRVQKFVLQK